MNCKVTTNGNEFTDILREMSGETTQYLEDYAITLNSGTEFNSKFVNWFYKTYPDINLSEGNYTPEVKETIKKGIIEYRNIIKKKIDSTVENNTENEINRARYRYTSVNAREFGRRTIVNKTIDVLNDTKGNITPVEIVKKVRASILAEALNRIAKYECEKANGEISDHQLYLDATRKQLQVELDKYDTDVDKLNAIVTFCIGKLPLSPARDIEFEESVNAKEICDLEANQNFNLISLIKELCDTTDNIDNGIPFVQKCLRSDSRVNRWCVNVEKFTDAEYEIDLDTGGLQTFDADIDFTKDETYRDYDNHDGLSKDALEQMEDDIKKYLSSLPVVSAYVDGTPKYDTHNELGIVDKVDLQTIERGIRTIVKNENIVSFIERLRQAADTKPQLKVLHLVVDRLESDPSFAQKFFRTFAHNNVKMIRVRLGDNGFASSEYYNTANDPVRSLYSLLHNAVRSRILEMNPIQAQALSDSFTTQLSTVTSLLENPNNKFTKEYIEESDNYIEQLSSTIINVMNKLYPDIPTDVIHKFMGTDVVNMLDDNNKYQYTKEHSENIIRLANKLTSILNKLPKVREAFDNRAAELQELKRKNKDGRLDEDIESIRRQDWSKYINEDSIDLANMFVPFTNVHCEFNHIDVNGKKASDVINDCYFLNFFNRLNNDIDKKTGFTSLELLAKEIGRSTQGDYTLLVEHVDEEGNIINEGLFTIDENGQYVPTSNAVGLMEGFLFDGVLDDSSSEAVKYDKMSEPDFVTTTYLMFFSSVNGRERYANYFMRTPSDASKDFVVSMPMYQVGPKTRTDSLLVRANVEEVNQKITSIMPNLLSLNYELPAGVSKEKIDKIILDGKAHKIESAETVFNHISANYRGENLDKTQYAIGSLVQVGDKRNNVFDCIKSFHQKDGKIIYYVIRGKLDTLNLTGTTKLKDSQFVGFINPEDITETGSFYTGIAYNLEKYLENKGEIVNEYTINRNHRIFKQLRNQYRQELINRATAISILFETDPETGEVLKDANGNLRFKPGYNENSTVENSTDLYLNYHSDDKGNIFTKKDGKLILKYGQVFNSSKFTVTHINPDGSVEVINYGKQIQDEVFGNPLYGGVQTGAIPCNENSGRFDVDLSQLTEEQQQFIDDKLAEFLQDFLATGREEYKPYLQFLSSNQYSEDKLNTYLVNYMMAYFAFDVMFEGDPDFYKGPIDFIKRAKETQGSGVGYANKDVNRIDGSEDKVSPQEAKYNSLSTFKINIPENGVLTEKSIPVKNTFNAICIHNTVKSMPEVADRISKALKKSGSTQEEINTLIQPFLKNTKVNDAQSYITLEEWIRRIAYRGQLDDYKDLIQKLYDENAPITAKDLENFVQIQKNFYFDHHYNSRSKVNVSRQIKNAEFVLVPRFIKGTELEQLYNIMHDNDIDQVNTLETSKAANTNILRIWDDAGNFIPSCLDDSFRAEINNSKEVFDYTYLYTQQETKQHLTARNKVGIQICKKLVDNLTINTKKLQDLKEEFHMYYYDNIIASMKDLCDALDIPCDDYGNVLIEPDGTIAGLNYKEFFKRMRDEAARQGLDSNTIQCLTLVEELSAEEIAELAPNRALSHGAQTVMPLIASNLIAKFESLAQSLYNNAITRQKFPGYHGPQTTSIGWQEYDVNNIAKGSTYGRKLQYHPRKEGTNDEVEAYIEIMLPRSAFGFDLNIYEVVPELDDNGNIKYDKYGNAVPQKLKNGKINYKRDKGGNKIVIGKKSDRQLLDEIETAELDKQIIYRIPTEGKYSVCLAKVAGFIDEGLGTTIVVPDEWVTQTGSDMDFDSIYSMVHHHRLNKDTGEIERFTEDLSDEALYTQYIKNQINKQSKKDELNVNHPNYRKVQAAKEAANEIANLKIARDTLRNKYNDAVADYIAKRNHYNSISKKNGVTKEQLANAEKAKNDAQAKANEIREEFMSTKFDYSAFGNNPNNDFISFDDFKQMNLSKKMSRESRDNHMLDTLIEIISDPNILKENINTSHSFDIEQNIEFITPSTDKQRRSVRNLHNILHVAKFQSEYMAGRALKGISVSLDNSVSVSNVVQPYLSSSVNIVYDCNYDPSSGYSRDEYIKRFGKGYSVEQLEKSFGKGSLIPTGEKNKYVIAHTRYGWSLDNRNVIGNIGTTDSAETTAYMLDIAKLGSIMNVNIDTFALYKLLPSIFSDYNVATSFSSLPGFTEIVNAQAEKKSIYLQSNKWNPVHTAIKRIAARIINDPKFVIDDNTSIDIVLEKLEANKDIINAVIGKNIPKDVKYDEAFTNDIGQLIYLDPVRNRARINAENVKVQDKNSDNEFISVPVEGLTLDQYRAIYDLGTVLQFMYLEKLANGVNSVASLINPDSYGAKADIYSTEQIFDRIYDIIEEGNCTLQVTTKTGDVVSIMEAIFPNIASVHKPDGTIDREASLIKFVSEDHYAESAYKPLYAFMRSVTGLSVVVNRMIFATQSQDFRARIDDVRDLFTYGKKLDQETNKDIEKYIVNNLVCKSKYISLPLTINPKDNTLIGTPEVLSLTKLETDTDPILRNKQNDEIKRLEKQERQRVFGYGYPPYIATFETTNEVDEDTNDFIKKWIPFEIADFNNPTQEEIDKYIKLSPAQKLQFVQARIDVPVLNKCFVANLFSFGSKYADRHSITFNEHDYSREEIYKVVNNLYYNNNPLLKLLAFDLVKYAYIAEGYKMGNKVINKAIPNTILLKTNGMFNSIVDDIIDNLNNVKYTSDEDYNKLFERYFQCHPGLRQIATTRIEKADRKTFIRYSYGMFSLANNDNNRAQLIKHNIASEDRDGNLRINSYVKIKDSTGLTLYKIKEGAHFIYLYPLNTFEENEDVSADFSVNPRNNKWLLPNFYEKVIADKEENNSFGDLNETISKFSEEAPKYRYVKEENRDKAGKIDLYALAESPKEKAEFRDGGYRNAIENITKFYIDNPESTQACYIWNTSLGSQFKRHGASGSGTTTVKLNINGTEVEKKFIITWLAPKFVNDNINHYLQNPSAKVRKNSLAAYIQYLKDNNITTVNENQIFSLIPVKEDSTVEESSVGRAGLDIIRGVKSDAVLSYESASETKLNYFKNGYKESETSIDSNPVKFYKIASAYARKEADIILERLHSFTTITDENGVQHYIDIGDKRVIEKIKNDVELRHKFRETLLMVDSFLNHYQNAAELKSELEDDPDLRQYLDDIKKAVQEVYTQTLPAAALKNYADLYLKDLSNNPMIRDGIISVMDGFYATSAVESWLADIQECPNPIIQMTYKEVMRKIDGASITGRENAIEFVKKWEAIEKAAGNAGVPIDIDKIIDENGNLRPEFNQKFLDDLTELQNNLKRIAEDPNLGPHTLEYLDAEIKLKKFKLKNLEQKLVDEYYQKEIEALELINNPDYKLVYEAYKKIDLERAEYVRNNTENTDPNYYERLRQFKEAKDNLTSRTFGGEPKTTPDDPDNPLSGDEAIIYSKKSADALRKHVKAMESLNEYFEREELHSFRETLKRNLEIINDFEMTNEGMSREARAIAIRNNEQYRNAYNWVKANASFVVHPSVGKLLKKAYKTLSGLTGDNTNATELVKSVLRDPKYKSSIKYINGELDVDSIPDEALNKIRAIQNTAYRNSVTDNLNDRLLITNGYATSPLEIFSKEFYGRMRISSADNKLWVTTVNQINDILKPYYNRFAKTIDTDKMSKDELKTVGELIEKLRTIKKHEIEANVTNNDEDTAEITTEVDEELKKVRKFMEDNVKTTISPEARALFNRLKYQAMQRGAEDPEYYEQWKRMNCEPRRKTIKHKGVKITVMLKDKHTGKIIYSDQPSQLMYGKMEPVDDVIKGTTIPTRDQVKTDAVKTINKFTSLEIRPSYFRKYEQMRETPEFNDWYAKNHIYNPYTHEMEPIAVWTRTEYKSYKPVDDDGNTIEMSDKLLEENFEPSFKQTERKIKKEYQNDNWDKTYGLFRLFKDSADSMYKSEFVRNQYEEQIRQLILNEILPLAKTDKLKYFVNKGRLPYKAQSGKVANVWEGFKKVMGFTNRNANSGKEWVTDNEIQYGDVSQAPIPFTAILENAETGERPRKSTYTNLDGTVDEEKYQQALDEYKKKRYDIHRKLLDRNYKDVISDFIQRVTRYNALQECQENLFFTRKLLENYNVLSHSNFTSYIKRLRGLDSSEEYEYTTEHDDNAMALYNNFLRRLVYDVWKNDHGIYTKMEQVIQSFISDKFMMANIYGGINNVLVGWTQMFAETNAGRYFGFGNSTWATHQYGKGISDYITGFATGKFTTLEGALIDLFNVVDYDEVNGVVQAEWDRNEIIKKVRNFMFSTNTAGEHCMQNSVLFAMLDSNRLIPNPSTVAGAPKYICMSEAEYLDNCYTRALEEILDGNQLIEFQQFKNRIINDKQQKKQYVEFNRDMTHDFLVNHCSVEQMKEFHKAHEKLKVNAREDFAKFPKFYDTFTFDSETKALKIADDSPLNDPTISQEDRNEIIADFSNKVKSVNKKIHGVYDKMGAARLETKFLGSLAMQYHKHIYPGIMKRYRRRGMYNESRNSIEKGSYQSLIQFLATPIDKAKTLTKDEKSHLKSLQIMFKTMASMVTDWRVYYDVLPDYDKENIRRQAGDMLGIVCSLILAGAIRLGVDKDDEEWKKARGMMLYVADRWDTESFMWNPIGLTREAKTLWAQPVAAQSIFVDIMDCINFYSDCLFEDDFEWNYTSGPHSGENKIAVRALRNIPIWRVIERYSYFDKQSRYYKRGGNGIFQDYVKKSIEENN